MLFRFESPTHVPRRRKPHYPHNSHPRPYPFIALVPLMPANPAGKVERTPLSPSLIFFVRLRRAGRRAAGHLKTKIFLPLRMVALILLQIDFIFLGHGLATT